MSAEHNPRTDERAPKPSMREALVAAAFELFPARGFEETTVDNIVARAGVGRRSFFRYFPSKEDVVFPDHDRCLADVTALLRDAPDGADPVAQVCDAARLVMRMYAENAAFSVLRYRLTKKVPALRAYELSVVRRYERTLADYLRTRYADRADGTLRAGVVAASVVAAHNHALRSWLRADGRGEAAALLDRALELVVEGWSTVGARPPADAPDDVVVVITKRGAPLWRVVRGVESALGEDRS